MITRVNGEVVAADTLWYPAMNFGQFRWPGQIGGYELELTLAEFVDQLGSAYHQCVTELRSDDELSSDPDPSPLRNAGYPPIALLLDHPAALFEAIDVFLWDELLGTVLPHPASAAARFMINSIEAATVASGILVIRG